MRGGGSERKRGRVPHTAKPESQSKPPDGRGAYSEHVLRDGAAVLSRERLEGVLAVVCRINVLL